MNEVINSILTRRSTRSFMDKQINDEELACILNAGIHAPNGRGKQSWHFAVVQNKENLDELKEACQNFTGRENNLYNAPTLVLVYADMLSTSPVEDGALAIGNMYLAAHSMGLGACWIYCFKDMLKQVKYKLLNEQYQPEEHYEVVGAIVLGYPNEEPTGRKPLKENTITFYK